MLSVYPWQQPEWRRLLEMKTGNRLPHALLLCGVEGIGLKHFAQVFAMRVLCSSNTVNGERACGQCRDCQLNIAGNHPDLLTVEPEADSKQIKIEQIRNLIDYVALKSFSADTKIAIIDPANAMNRFTANALLKTLEEPPEQSRLILISHRPSLLPITIRSRCQRIDFKPAYGDAAISWLKEHIDPTAVSLELLLAVAYGGPLHALNLAERDVLSYRNTLLDDMRALCRGPVDVTGMAARWHELGGESVLNSLLQLLQDLIHLKLPHHNKKLINQDIKQDLQDLVKTVDLPALVRNYDFTLKTFQELNAPLNYNPLALLEAVLVSWQVPEQV